MRRRNLRLEMFSILWLTLFLGPITSAPTTKVPELTNVTRSFNGTGKPISQNDKEIFWEVTKQPEHTLAPTRKNTFSNSDFVDGNHPNLPPVLTHEEVDTDFQGGLQSKRVKKILPPFHHANNETIETTKPSPKTPPAPTADNNNNNNNNTDVLGNSNSTEPLRPALVEELTVTQIRKNPIDIKPGLQTGFPGLSEKHGEETYNENERAITTKENLDNVADDIFIPVGPTQVFNIHGTSPADVTENETAREILDVTPPADWIFEENTLRKTKEGDVIMTVSTTVTHSLEVEDGELEIEGIRLVPEGKHPTTERTMWDLIQEQQHSASDETHRDENNVIYPEAPRALPYQGQSQTSKPLFVNFDAESQEMEYESENFQRGFSNIEKHELPLSYVLPWLQVEDKSYESGKDAIKFKETKVKDLESRSRLAAVSSDEEELRIPADMSRLLRLSELPELGADVAVSVVQSGATDAEPRGRTKWYLLLLTGNSTIVQRRRDDFTKYLRLNLAARLSVEYDDVKVNKLILAPPRVLVNVSVYAPSDDIAEESQLDLKEKFEEKGEGPLHKLAESNATLLELSGEEYKVVRFLSLQGQQPAAEAQKDAPRLTSMSSRHEDIEFVIYTFLGSACACAILLTLFIALNKYLKKWKEVQWPWKQLKTHKLDSLPERPEKRCTVPPAVIYSGGFPQIRGSWMGPPAPPEPPSASSSSASLLQRYPGIELGASQPESPRHSKLRIYNCRADRVLVRKLQDNNNSSSNSIDVKIPGQNAGADNPSFIN